MLICVKCGMSYEPSTESLINNEAVSCVKNNTDVAWCNHCIEDFLDFEENEKLVKDYLNFGEKIRTDFLKYIEILKMTREIDKDEEKRLYDTQVTPVVQDERKSFQKQLKKLMKKFSE